MIISQEKQLIYVANPKCASMSIHAALYPLVESEMTPELLEILRMHDSHATRAEVEPYLNLQGVNTQGYYSFGVKRNPYDRLVSFAAWEYADVFAIDPEAALAYALMDNSRFARPQVEFLAGIEHVVEYRHLGYEWPKLMEMFDWPISVLPRENEGAREPDYEQYFTPQLRKATQDKYAQDFEVLGYAK